MYPKFRPDLEISSLEEHGERLSHILKDPVSGKFFRVSAYELVLLRAFDGTRSLDEVVEGLGSTGHFYAIDEAKRIIETAARMGLLLGTKMDSADSQIRMRETIRKAKKDARFAEVFFLFIPLVNPDRFLEKTLRLFKLLWNRGTAWLLVPAGLGAVYLFIDGFHRLSGQFSFFFNLENLLYLWITIAITKFFHELAHAYTAKQYGLHVPQMGVAFLIFFPCLFCNTTDAWRLASRKQRIAIGGAGIVAELVLAVIATYVWYFTKPGIINSLAFYLMAVASILTILFNGNPLIRFDGYFVLSDLLRIPNLMTKSRGFVKYLFLNRALGLESVPNPAHSSRERSIFIVHGIAAVIYRFFLYTGIVVGVYYRFGKLLGILLALLAIAMFVVRPSARGLAGLYSRRREMKPRLIGMTVLAAIVTCAAVALFVPLSRTSIYSCYLAPWKVRKLTVPLQTSITDVFVREGSIVRKGSPLFGLDTSELQLTRLKKRIDLQILKGKVELLAVDQDDRAAIRVKRSEFSKAANELRFIEKELRLAKHGVAAPFDGVVRTLDHRVQKGFRPGEGVVVGEVQSVSDLVVFALVHEDELVNIHANQPVEIWFPVDTGLLLNAKIDIIRPYSEKNLNESPFSSRLGGEVATEPKGERTQDVPIEPIYLCGARLRGNPHGIPLGMTGKLVVPRPPKSYASLLVDNAVRAFNRESLF